MWLCVLFMSLDPIMAIFTVYPCYIINTRADLTSSLDFTES